MGRSLESEQVQSLRPRPVVLFDGLCNLCTGAVRFVLERDARKAIDFASLQSAIARRRLAEAGAHVELPDSIVLLDAEGVHVRSDAALRIAARLRAPWPLLAAFRVVPRALRDPIYDFVARHRYGWFGKRDACLVPTPELRARFLDAGEPPVSASAPATPPPSPGA
jgi:predicted DCC family thiol-disulfide oxidoreductase YuxK